MEQTFLDRIKEASTSFWDRNVREPSTRFLKEAVLGDEVQSTYQSAPVEVMDEAMRKYGGLHSILKYDQYEQETGLFYNDNSVSFCFEIIPQTGADEDMAARLTTLFSPIPPDTGIQWCLFGSPILDRHFEAYLDQRRIAVDQSRAIPFFKELAERRIKYVKGGRGKSLWPTENYLIKNIRVLFSITKTGSYRDADLVKEMSELREMLLTTLRSANLPGYALDANGLIEFLWPILNPEVMFDDTPFPDVHYDDGKSIKEQVTNFGHHVRVNSSEILFGLPSGQKEEDEARVAVRAYGMLQYPKKRELWEMANIIGSFFDSGLQYPCPFLICSGVFTLDPNLFDMEVENKVYKSKKHAKSVMAEYQPELKMQAENWEVVEHHRHNGGSMCQIYHTLLLFAPKNTINRAGQVAVNIWRSQRFMICPLNFIHLPAFYASLPMTLTEGVRDDLRMLRIISKKTTVNAVDMAPVLGEWTGSGDPIMMFFGRRGGISFLDFYSNQQGNYNVFVAGVSGSGKSVVMNEIVSSYRSIGARVWVIDVGRSYRNLIALQKGTFLEFTPETKICINPFSWVGTDSDLGFKSEMRLLKPMVGRMASPNAPLTEFQYALITEAITSVWHDYGQDTNPTLIRDYLQSKIKNERGDTERVAYELAKQLQPFTKDGVFGHFFNGPANISFDDDIIGLELEELKNAPELRRVVLFVLTSRIANDMYLSRDRKKLCLIDEAWQLLGSDSETAEFIEEGYRRARKYNGIFCVGTQGIEDAYKNEASQAAYNNADWKIFLRQDRKNLQKLIDDGLVSFSPAIKKMLLSLRTEKGRFSEMMISSPNGEAVVRHIPDPFSLLMASTNAADYNECEYLLSQGHSTMEALTLMLERRGHHHA